MPAGQLNAGSFNLLPSPAGSTDPTIIYTLTRRDTEDLTDALQPVFKDSIAMYHGGMSNPQRSAVHHRFINDELEVGVPLSASFGDGMVTSLQR